MLGSVEASNGEGSTEINDKEKTKTDHPGKTCDATPRYENIETEETELQMGVKYVTLRLIFRGIAIKQKKFCLC